MPADVQCDSAVPATALRERPLIAASARSPQPCVGHPLRVHSQPPLQPTMANTMDSASAPEEKDA
jgi:hypothetical protein